MKMYSLKTLFPFLFLFLFLTSCLKDKDYDNGLSQSIRNNGTDQNIIEMQLTATATDNFLLSAFNATNSDTVFNLIPIVLASPNVAKEDIHVTLELNNTLVTDYNTANSANLVIAAPAKYTILNAGNVVTIPQGSRVGYLQVKFKPSDFIGPVSALGFTIGNIDKAGYAISGNFKNGIAAIAIKNKYDGVYEITGTLTDANGLYTGDYGDPAAPRTYQLSTTGPSSVLFYDESWDFQNYIVINIASGAPANTGIRPQFTFDPASDVITSITNAANGAAITVGPNSRFNPADRSIDVDWTLGRWHVHEHYTYLHER